MFKDIKDDSMNYRNLYNGQWISSKSNQYIEIYSPVDQQLVGKVPTMMKEEVDLAIHNTKEAQKKWANTSISDRSKIMHKTADLLEEQAEVIASVMMKEIAKDKKSAISEVLRTADFIRFTADTAKNLEGEAITGDRFPGGSMNKLSFVTRVPLGTVLAISPFNYPVNLSASKIAPALMAGNAVLLKPPTQGSISALYLAKVFQEAGLPNGLLNTITGKGSEIGDYIVTHPGIDFINFTGSTEVGQHISKISTMTPLMLELGGKDAAIVLKDADLIDTADQIVAGAYSYSGQRCTAVKRILVVEEVADELVKLLHERIQKLKVGLPDTEGVTITPLISDKAADFVQELIDDAKNKGAQLIIGDKRIKNLMEPTLFDHVTTDMRLAWEEPFGPVLPVIRIKTLEDAITIANSSEYGLQSSIFTSDIDSAFYIAKQLEVGTVQINNKTERGPDHFPFLGVKASGMGTQGVRYSIEAMSRPKAIVINTKH